MNIEIEMEGNNRSSKIIPGYDQGAVEGLQYRRGSRKLSLTFNSDEIKPTKLEEVKDDEDSSTEEIISYAPDGGYGWFIVLASFLCNFVLDGISLSQSALEDSIRKASGIAVNYTEIQSTNSSYLQSIKDPEYNITSDLYQLLPSVLLCVTLSVGPFISLLTDRFGFRMVSLCGSILASLGILLSFAVSPYTPNIWALVVLFGGLGGIGFGMMFQPSIVIVGLYFEKRRPLATGIAIAGTGAGTFAFPPILEAIATTWGWQGAYIFQSVIVLISASFAMLYSPLPTKSVKINTKIPQLNLQRRPSYPLPEVEKFGLKSMLKAMIPLSKSVKFLFISISGAITMLGFFAPYSFISAKGLHSGLSKSESIWLVSYIGIANTVGRLIFGLISCHPWIDSLTFSNSALTVAGIATILVSFANAYYQLILYAIIFGFGIAVFTVLRSILVMHFMGIEKFNNAFGLSLLFMGIGTLIGNPLGARLYEYTGSYDVSFYAAGTYLLISAMMCYPLRHISDWEKRRSKKLTHEQPLALSTRKSLVL